MILIIIMLLIVVFLFGLIQLLFGICTYGDPHDEDDDISSGLAKIFTSVFLVIILLAISEKDAEHVIVIDRKQVEMPVGNIEGEVIVELKQRLSIVEDSVAENRTDINGNRELILRIVANDTLSKQEMLEKLNPDDCTVIDEIITCEIQ